MFDTIKFVTRAQYFFDGLVHLAKRKEDLSKEVT
jgi:hypothetical protein